WEHHDREEIPWEIFGGQLLDSSQTRLTESFESWNIYWNEGGHRSTEPLISLKLDSGKRLIHVVRSIHRMIWQGYHAGDNVYLSREVTKWVPELVGTARIDELVKPGALRDELICLVFQAVVGTSRLPLTSVESPLPSFSLGQLASFYRSVETQVGRPLRSYKELIEQALDDDLNDLERVRLLETVLRTVGPEDMEAAAGSLASRWQGLGWDARTMV